jgi:hypothetical protein
MASITIKLTEGPEGFPILEWSRDLEREYGPGDRDIDLEAPLVIAALAAIDAARAVLHRLDESVDAPRLRLATIDGTPV